MQPSINITINLHLTLDESTNSYTIKNQTIQLQPPEESPLEMRRKLGVAEKRYGILTLGAKSVIGRKLPPDIDITVIYDGKSYPAHTHKTNPGRIDRLSALVKHFSVNKDELFFQYDPDKKELRISLV